MATRKTATLEAQTAQRAATKAELLAKKPRTAKVIIVLDDDLVIAHDEKLEELERARGNGHKPEEVKALEAELKAAAQAVRGKTVAMIFRGVGNKAYDALVDQHPPTAAQIAETEAAGLLKPPYDTDTFPIALVAASMSEPTMTVEDVQQIWDEWNRSELAAIFMTAMDVNSRARQVTDLGKGSG